MTDHDAGEATAFIISHRNVSDLTYGGWVARLKEGAEKLRQRSGLSFDDFLDAVALHTAREFIRGRMSYTDGDLVANDLWRLWIFSLPPLDSVEPVNRPIPPVMERVFLAFDAGEFLHPSEPPGVA